jgi:hypothetical protein
LKDLLQINEVEGFEVEELAHLELWWARGGSLVGER